MTDLFTILMLPFLKTSEPLTLGGLTLRSTEDLGGLDPTRMNCVREVHQMLFARDDLWIRSATYAIVPYVDLDRPLPDLSHIENIQSTVAYFYSSPMEVFGKPFLSTEHASIVLFSPTSVPESLLTQHYNLQSVGPLQMGPRPRYHTLGYSGLFNFRHHFWATRGSRVYGPLPFPTFNISQDLSIDLTARDSIAARTLLRILDEPTVPIGNRVLRALRWYNSANREAADEFTAVVHLSIAFEALLGLPASEKTDRLVDAIAILLGRIPRLDEWARQFYSARSAIVHEGHASRLDFVTIGENRKHDNQVYHSLFSYGSTVFRLCLSALIVGAEMAQVEGLQERFVTNQERFTRLCVIFSDTRLSAWERLARSSSSIASIGRFQFVGESGLRLETMLTAVRLGLSALIEAGIELDPQIRGKSDEFMGAPKTEDHFDRLVALNELRNVLPANIRTVVGEASSVFSLIQSVCSMTFIHYMRLSHRKKKV